MTLTRACAAAFSISIFAGCLSGTAQDANPATGAPARSAGGGAFTTFDRTLGGCLDSPNGVNCNHYTARDRVYLTGGPVAAGLADGVYFFAVIAPGTQNGGFLDGAVGNLSDTVGGPGYTAGDRGSGDPVSNRTFTVRSHEITQYAGTHARGINPAGRFVLGLAPFDDTPNAGGVYTLAICRAEATSPSQCTFDAFMIRSAETPSDGGTATDGPDVPEDVGTDVGMDGGTPEDAGVDGGAPEDHGASEDSGVALDRASVIDGASVIDSDTTDGGLPSDCATTTIRSNFNGTSIAAGHWIWFRSVGTVRAPSSGAALNFVRQAIEFSAGGVPYRVTVPNARVVIDPAATTATTTYDARTGAWQTTVPLRYSGNLFLSGVALPVGVGGLPGGINPVTWTGTFTTNVGGVSVQWQWAAAVYTRFGDDMNALGVKPVDDGSLSVYRNADHAGTPEAFRDFVTGGARGGGGSNFTGSLSATASAAACSP